MTTDLTLDLKLPGFDGENPQVIPQPVFDPEEYRAEMADLDLTERQEIEFLETLWSIMGTFARMGFDVDVCGLIFEDFNEAATGNDKLAGPISTETSSIEKDRGST